MSGKFRLRHASLTLAARINAATLLTKRASSAHLFGSRNKEPFTQSMLSTTESITTITDKRCSNHTCCHVSSLLTVISYGIIRSEPLEVLSAKRASIITFSTPILPYIYSIAKSPQNLSLSCKPRHAIMNSISFTFMVLIVNVLVIPLKASEQSDRGSSDELRSRPSGSDPSTPYPKTNPHSSSQPNAPRRRNTRRDGKSCQQRSNSLNPLRNPYDLDNPVTEGPNLPIVRAPFADDDERYCPMFQYVVCDSGFDNDRILRVASGKWRLKNCNRCK